MSHKGKRPHTKINSGVLTPLYQALKLYGDANVVTMFLCWFVCGIPLLLTASTYSYWLSDYGIDKAAIGLLGWVAFPYTIRFLWAPFVDRWSIPFLTRALGHRRSWMLAMQLGLFFTLLALANTNPAENLILSAIFAIGVAFFSATLDFIVMAYQIERLPRRQYGTGEAMGIFGFRVGMLVSGAGAISLARTFSWQGAYTIMAFCLLIGPIVTLFIKEPEKSRVAFHNREKSAGRSRTQQPGVLYVLYDTVVVPFKNFIHTQPWVMAILIMFFSKISDNLIGNFTNIFLAETGFTKLQIASVSKMFGMAATIIGGLFAGFVIGRFGVLRCFFCGIIIHALSILMFCVIAEVGNNLNLLYLAIGLEHFTGGLRTTSLLVLQMMLVTPEFAATQISLLNSVLHLSRKTVGSFSGFMINAVGWKIFFLICATASVFSLIILGLFAKNTIKRYDHLGGLWHATR